MKKLFLLLTIGLFFIQTISAQRLEKFSDDQKTFMSELNEYMTSSKRKAMEDLMKDFEKAVKKGMFTPEEIAQIRSTGNVMLSHNMSASPYFERYIKGLLLVNNVENGAERFANWHVVLNEMMVNIENRKVKPYQNFLGFSVGFFESNAFRDGGTNTSWIAEADTYNMKVVDGAPVIEYDKLDIFATRRSDTIYIKDTKGTFYPAEGIWKGEGGKVTWERFDLPPDVYAELTDYEIEIKKAIYKTETVYMHYPLFFGDKKVEGSFEDKLVTANRATEGSYPRFKSKESILKLKNIGDGIDYVGGFRLEGTIVYGFGSKETPAEITISERDQLVFRGYSELFKIRRGDRIVGEGVTATIYYENDTLYHPSVGIRFEIPDKILKLNRGNRGSDRNPFYSSMHNINMEVDKMDYFMQQDSIVIGQKSLKGTGAKQQEVVFESLEYFDATDYGRFQNIASYNPLNVIKASAERTEDNKISANDLAYKINSKFTVDNIKPLLYDLVKKGFINYDADTEIVEVKAKLYHYVNAAQKKVDYDKLQIISDTKETNATLDLKTKTIGIKGVSSVVLSDKQKVAIRPFKKNIYIEANRDMEFAGKTFAGFSTFEGNDFFFHYDKFDVQMDSIRYFDLFLPTGEVDEKTKEPKALSIGSRIEHLSGVLLIDAPQNKAGREEIDMFPSFQSKKESFVFYDAKQIRGGTYKRDSFFFELKPFSFNSLDRFVPEDVHFKGKLVSADIFPDIEETLVVIPDDQSLGFNTKTAAEGLPNYVRKGNYTGALSLSNKGLLGVGTQDYLGASIDAENFVFHPKVMTCTSEKFDLEEERSGVEVPQVRGYDVNITWRPYKDSMYVRSKEAPFELYKSGTHTLKGILILTPDGLKGDGLLDWPKASMESDIFSFGAFSTQSDTTSLKIRAFDADALALETTDLNGNVDFDEQKGYFKGNADKLYTKLPYNKYETSFNDFDWDMKNETITFKAKEGQQGNFLSVHPDQDSLVFNGEAAIYDLKTSSLNIDGVEKIISADAFIFPQDAKVEVLPGGKMTNFENATIKADTINQYHVINRCNVQILGRKEYRANGFYEYNLADKEQEIRFDEIIGTRVGKGSRADKATATRATGEVTDKDKFYIDYKTEYRGTISLSSDSKNLDFDGYARLESTTLPSRHWFTVAFEGDKKDLAIKFDTPKNYKGEPLSTGLFLSKETTRIYPRVMGPLYFRKDRPIVPVTGYLKYDKNLDQFELGDSLKTIAGTWKGNRVYFNNKTGGIEAEGRWQMGHNLTYATIQAAGKGTVSAPPQDTSQLYDPLILADLMLAIDLMLPDDLKKMMLTDFESSSFDATPINYTDNLSFYRKALAELFPFEEKNVNQALMNLSQGILDLPKKHNKHTFLFSKVPMKWDADYQSFISNESTVQLASIDGQMLNKNITAYIECKMPTSGDDRLYIYIKSPSDLYYFFGFKGGILNVVSNNLSFNDVIINMKDKDRIKKMKDGETYEIQPVNIGSAQQFVARVKAAQQ